MATQKQGIRDVRVRLGKHVSEILNQVKSHIIANSKELIGVIFKTFHSIMVAPRRGHCMEILKSCHRLFLNPDTLDF